MFQFSAKSNNNINFYHVIKPCHFLNKIFGVYPFSLKQYNGCTKLIFLKKDVILIFWQFFIFTCFFYKFVLPLLIYSLDSFIVKYHPYTKLDYIIFHGMYCLLNVYLIIYMSFFYINYSKINNLFNIAYDIDKFMLEINIKINYYYSLKYAFKNSFVLFFAMILLHLMNTRDNLILILVFIFSSCVANFTILFIANLMNEIKNKLQALCENLNLIFIYNYRERKLFLLKVFEIYYKIINYCEFLGSIFQIILFCLFSGEFYSIIENFYYMAIFDVILQKDEFDNMHLLYLINCNFLIIYKIMLIVSNVTAIKNQVSYHL